MPIRSFRVNVDGETFSVTLEETTTGISVPAPAPSAAPASVPAAPPAPAARPAAAPGAITSPLAGRVVSVDCKVGDNVAEGAQLLTLEAMKMHTIVYATHAGRVTAILTETGQPVEEGQPLVNLE